MKASSADAQLDLNRSAVARYIQLASLFRRRIESGQWAVGQQIPTVDELAVECGVARATIRQALDLLATEHLIERFRAKGTFVRKSDRAPDRALSRQRNVRPQETRGAGLV